MIYIYYCEKDKKEVELNRKIDERDNPVKCEICKELMVRKLVSHPIIYNVGGFYKKDNAK